MYCAVSLPQACVSDLAEYCSSFTWVDLQVDATEADRLAQRIKTINGMATLQKAQNADVSVDYILGVGGFDFDRISDEVLPPLPVSLR